jgi:hypothetical protein
LQRPESQEEVPKKHSGKEREVAVDPLESTTTGALLLQSLLRLHPPHNALVFNRCARCDSTSTNFDYAAVASNHCHQKFCSRSFTTLQLRVSSTRSSMAQISPRVPVALCSAHWRHSSRTSLMTALVLESARAAGRRRTLISRYVVRSYL